MEGLQQGYNMKLKVLTMWLHTVWWFVLWVTAFQFYQQTNN